MAHTEIFNSINEILIEIEKENKHGAENVCPRYPSLIKVKCICCTETPFVEFVMPQEENGRLIIRQMSVPKSLVESLTVRYKTPYGKMDVRYKVAATTLNALLNEKARMEMSFS